MTFILRKTGAERKDENLYTMEQCVKAGQLTAA
jgi:hypothetical protein